MQGRLEHELMTKRNIDNLLHGLPQVVTDYYYNIQISKEPKTCVEYIRKIAHFLNYIQKDLTTITDSDIGRYFNYISYTSDKEGEIKKTSFSYKKTVWSALNGFFKYLTRKRVIAFNPMDNTERPKAKDNVKRTSLTMDDLNAILNVAKSGCGSDRAISYQKKWRERDILILFLFMNTGMRKTALSEINIEDISFNNKEITIIDKRNKILKYPISQEMERIICTWLIKREGLLKGTENDALFISAKRNRLSVTSIYELVQKYSEEALGYAISPHKLRGAFTTLYYEASGGDIEATRRAVGHESIATTSMYITRKNNAREDAANFMSKNLKI